MRKVAAKYKHAAVPGDYTEYEDHGHWVLDEPGTVSEDITRWPKQSWNWCPTRKSGPDEDQENPDD